MKKILFSILITFSIFLLPKDVGASTLTLTPGHTSLGIGSTKSFQVRLNTQGEAVNAVQAVLAYPQDLVDIVSIVPTNNFSVQAEQTFGGGNIKIARGNVDPVNGTVTVATINIRGKSLGSATVYFTTGSAVPRASDSTDSLVLAQSIGSVISVGGTVTSSASELPLAGSLGQTLALTIAGGLLALFGILGIFIVK